MGIEFTNKVEYGVEEIDGQWVPGIRLGIRIGGNEVELVSNIKFRSMEEARAFILTVHRVLTGPESKNYNYDREGRL